jgi:hypothetical protein
MANYFKDIQRGVTFGGRMIKFGKNGSPLDLTGVIVEMQFRLRKEDGPIFEFKTSDNSILITTPLNGEMYMAERCMEYPEGDYFYTLKIIFPNGTKKKPINDRWKIY